MNIKSLLKKKSVWAALVIILAGGYYYYHSRSSTGPTQYVLSQVEKGTITVSIDGTGQISASNQIDVKPQVSGTVLSAPIKEGQTVKAGSVLVQLDATNALKSVRDAQLSLDSAKLSLAKLTEPPDQLSITQAQNALSQAEVSQQNAEDDLVSSYEDAFNDVASTFLDLPSIVTGVHDILFNSDLAASQWNIDYFADAATKYEDVKTYQYKTDAENKFNDAYNEYLKNFEDYKATSRLSDTSTIEQITSETYSTSKNLAEAVKSATNFIQFYEDTLTSHGVKYNSLADNQVSSLNSYTSKLNSDINLLLNIQNTLQNDKNSIIAAQQTIAEKTQSLAKLQAGADPLDVQSAQLNVKQKEASLADAQGQLAYYTVRAPIDGIVAKLDVVPTDQAGSGGVVATMIGNQQVAQISLNEVDAAKITVGQKATLTFDAIDGLNLTGIVSEIDTLGTVTQGVVTYNVKITLDTQDSRVKSGMSVSASIITDVKQDALIVPNSAIKTQGNSQYVEVLGSYTPAVAGAQGVTSGAAPRRVPISVGLANDTESEILSGLKEGDQVITRTIGGAGAPAATSQAPSILQTGGARGFGGGGGGFRGAGG